MRALSAVMHRGAHAARLALVATGADRLVASGLLWSRLRPDNAHYPAPTIREATLDGIAFKLDLSDYMQWSAYFGIERQLRETLYKLAEPGGVAIDIGTNVGEVLLNLARRVGPNGRAIGFEPNPETYQRCAENLALNPGLKAEVHALALSDKVGVLSLGRHCSSNSGADRVMREGPDTIEITATTLDRFVQQSGLARIDMIKIDVEGFEQHVLSGSEVVIGQFRPIMFIELSDDNLRAQDESASGLVAWLEARNFSVENAANGNKVTASDKLDGCFFDIIARPLILPKA